MFMIIIYRARFFLISIATALVIKQICHITSPAIFQVTLDPPAPLDFLLPPGEKWRRFLSELDALPVTQPTVSKR